MDQLGEKRSNREEQVILVDENDEAIGVGEKLEIHRQGKLHRAFSIFVFNAGGELLLQKRAGAKYHSSGLWSNTCCGHPRPGEFIEHAARRRLQEEMGFVCDLKDVFQFTYKVQLSDEISEHECDHVLVGVFDGEPQPFRDEVDDWRWIGLKELREDIQERPDRYTYWLKVALSLLPAEPINEPEATLKC